MPETQNTPIIHITGPSGSGKTTLCRLFLNAFNDKSVLVIDASTDNFLMLAYGIYSPMNLAGLAQQTNSISLNREAVDWALHDLPVSISTENPHAEVDIMAWGQLPANLSPTQKDMLSYGLPRLFSSYDVVLWDGPMDISETVFAPSEVSPLLVITPEDEDYCKKSTINKAMVLLSKAQTKDILPPTAELQIQRGNWKFLGKLPPLSPPEKRIKELPAYFQDCFYKLDLPFELKPRMV